MSRVPMLPDYGGAIGRVNWQNSLADLRQKQAQAQYAPQYFQGQANLEQGIGGIEQANALVAPQQAQANLAVTKSQPSMNYAQANSLNQTAGANTINTIGNFFINHPAKAALAYKTNPQFKAIVDNALKGSNNDFTQFQGGNNSNNSLNNSPPASGTQTGFTSPPISTQRFGVTQGVQPPQTSVTTNGPATSPGVAQGQSGSGSQSNQSDQTPLGYKTSDDFVTNYSNLQNSATDRAKLLQNYAMQEYEDEHGYGSWLKATPEQKIQQLKLIAQAALSEKKRR